MCDKRTQVGGVSRSFSARPEIEMLTDFLLPSTFFHSISRDIQFLLPSTFFYSPTGGWFGQKGGLYCSPACRSLESLQRHGAHTFPKRGGRNRECNAEGPDTPPPILRRGRAGSFNNWASIESALDAAENNAISAPPLATPSPKPPATTTTNKPSPSRKSISFSDLPPPPHHTSSRRPQGNVTDSPKKSPLHRSLVLSHAYAASPPTIHAPVPHSPPLEKPRHEKGFIELLERAVGTAELSSTPHWTLPTPFLPTTTTPQQHEEPLDSKETEMIRDWIPDSPEPHGHEYAVSAPALLMRGWRVVTPPILAHRGASDSDPDPDLDSEDEEDSDGEDEGGRQGVGTANVENPRAHKGDGVETVLSILKSILLLDDGQGRDFG